MCLYCKCTYRCAWSKWNVLSFMIWNLLLKIWIYRYWTQNNDLDLPYPNKGRWEVSENVKYITVTSRDSKLPISEVRLLRDLNGDFSPIYFFTFGSASSDLRPTPLSNQQIWSLWALIVHVQKVWFKDAWELTFHRLAKSAAPKDLLSKIYLSWFFEKKLFMFWLFSPTFY